MFFVPPVSLTAVVRSQLLRGVFHNDYGWLQGGHCLFSYPAKLTIIACVRGPGVGKPKHESKFKFKFSEGCNSFCDAFLSIRPDLSTLSITCLYVTKR